MRLQFIHVVYALSDSDGVVHTFGMQDNLLKSEVITLIHIKIRNNYNRRIFALSTNCISVVGPLN